MLQALKNLRRKLELSRVGARRCAFMAALDTIASRSGARTVSSLLLRWRFHSTGIGTPAPSLPPEKSIAVLPAKAINSANRDEIYEIGIADSLILKLSSMKGFVVRPLSVMRKYADVGQEPLAAGREQKADYVLASNYQLEGGKIRITAQLLNVASGQIEETYKSEKDAAISSRCRTPSRAKSETFCRRDSARHQAAGQQSAARPMKKRIASICKGCI